MSVAGGMLETISGDGDDNGDGFNEGGGFWQAIYMGVEMAITFDDAAGTLEQSPTIALRVRNAGNVEPAVVVDGEPLAQHIDFLSQTEDGDLWLFIDRIASDGTTLAIAFE